MIVDTVNAKRYERMRQRTMQKIHESEERLEQTQRIVIQSQTRLWKWKELQPFRGAPDNLVAAPPTVSPSPFQSHSGIDPSSQKT